MQNTVVKGMSVLSIGMLLASCVNTQPLVNNDVRDVQKTPKIPVTPTAGSLASIKPTPTVTIDWAKIEAAADQMYEDNALSPAIFSLLTQKEFKAGSAADFYAKDFNVSIEEAQRRLILQGISGPLINAVARELGDTVTGIYYENDNPKAFSVNFITLNTVKANPPRYVYQFKHKDFECYSLTINTRPSSKAARSQIFALQEKASSEILKRYPDTQAIGYSPSTNTIHVRIYTETPDEAEKKRIEAALTEVVGHLVTVKFVSSRIQTL